MPRRAAGFVPSPRRLVREITSYDSYESRRLSNVSVHKPLRNSCSSIRCRGIACLCSSMTTVGSLACLCRCGRGIACLCSSMTSVGSFACLGRSWTVDRSGRLEWLECKIMWRPGGAQRRYVFESRFAGSKSSNVFSSRVEFREKSP